MAGRKQKVEPKLNPDETLSACTCPKCGTRFQVAVRALGPKAPRPSDPRQLPLFESEKKRKRVSLSEILGDE